LLGTRPAQPGAAPAHNLEGGKGKAEPGTRQRHKAQLQEMADNVLSGQQDRAAAAVAGQLLNIKLRAIEVERKVRETEELAREVEELREFLQGGRGSRWGA
jgi:hypothetical protein